MKTVYKENSNLMIPKINLRQFTEGGPEARTEFVKQTGRAFRDIGFVSVVEHGIDRRLIDDFYAAAHQFFALPPAAKQEYEIPGMAGQRGYTSFGVEHAKHSEVADLKEFFQIGQELPEGDPWRAQYPDNVRVDELPGFLDLGVQLFRAFESAGGQLLRAVALYLELPQTYFDPKIEKGNSILRAIHYPPITREPKKALRAEQHEDINLITLLVGASAGGLEILTRENEWMPILPQEEEIVINVGDMLQRLTNDYLKSTTHRVVNPPREEWHLSRLSIPFFLHPRANMDLTCLPACVSNERPAAYRPIKAGQYLEERLREIGLKE